MRAVITPIAETYFAGRFSRDGARRLMPRILARFMPDVDLRDAEAFRTWAATLAPRLQAALVTESDRA